MSRDKQIEEMAEIITSADPYVNCKGQPCLTCEYQDIVHNCYSAKAIYNAGYRKASDVALEVISEIKEATENHIKAISRLEPQNDYCAGGKKALEMTLKVLAELKKKYTEEGK